MNDATRKLNPGLTLPGFDPTLGRDEAGRATNSITDEMSASRRLLDQDEAAMTRTNWRNDGRGFQKEIEQTCGAYQNRRAATLRKVDPPTRVIGTAAARRVIFLPNPFLDFAGSWTARHGRALFVEAKSTSTHRLPFARSGGVTAEQVTSISNWRLSGAAAAVLWQYSGKVVLILPEDLLEAGRLGLKSLVFETLRPVPRGTGSVIWDFLPVLEAALWPPKPPECSP